MKNILIGLVALIVLGGLGFYVTKNKDTNNYANNPANNQNTSEEVVATSTEQVTGVDVGEKSYSLVEVATHNSKESCWAAVNGKVYDLTSWISKHPGGESAILSICGKDGTDKFVGKHEGDEKPEAKLATFYIGLLTQ